MANTYNGTGILFGSASTAGTLTGIGTITLMQGSEVGGDVSKVLVPGPDGNTKTVVYSDHTLTAKLDFIPSSGTNTGTMSVTASVSAGNTLVLTDTSFTPIAGTWLVDAQPTYTTSNVGPLKVSVNLIKYLQNTIP